MTRLHPPGLPFFNAPRLYPEARQGDHLNEASTPPPATPDVSPAVSPAVATARPWTADLLIALGAASSLPLLSWALLRRMMTDVAFSAPPDFALLHQDNLTPARLLEGPPALIALAGSAVALASAMLIITVWSWAWTEENAPHDQGKNRRWRPPAIPRYMPEAACLSLFAMNFTEVHQRPTLTLLLLCSAGLVFAFTLGIRRAQHVQGSR